MSRAVYDLSQGHHAGGTTDARDHGAGADLQRFVTGQRRGHVEDDLPGEELDLELPSGFFDGDGSVRVKLDGFGVVQADVGAARVAGSDAIAAVKLDALEIGQGDAAGVLDGDAALHQLHMHGDGLGRGSQGRSGEPQHQEECKNNRKKPFHTGTSESVQT